MVSSLQVTLFLIILIFTVVFALILASRKESNVRFIIWGVIILFLPFIGALAYIINYYTSKKKIQSA